MIVKRAVRVPSVYLSLSVTIIAGRGIVRLTGPEQKKP